MINIHIVLNSFVFESRVLKESGSLTRSGLVSRCFVLALQGDGMPEHEEIDACREVWRINLRSRGWPADPFFIVKGIRYLELCWHILSFSVRNKVDLVNVHSWATLPLGFLVKILCGAKLVYDTHELETEAFALTGMTKWVAKLIERLLIRRADLVIVVGDAISDWYRKEYDIENVATVLNSPPRYERKESNLLREELGISESRRIILYQGGLIRGRGIEGLLAAYSELKDDRFALVFMGYGALEELIWQYAAPGSGIYLQKAVNPGVVLDYTSSADVGVSYIDNPSLNDRYCLPNKFFEYISAGLTVIVNDAPEMARYVRNNSIGAVLGELSKESLADALEQLEQMDKEELAVRLDRVAADSCWETQEERMLAGYHRWVVEKNV